MSISNFEKYKKYISPLFLPLFYNTRDIKCMIEKYKFRGSVLDFGCGSKPYKFLFKYSKSYLGIDFKKHYSSKYTMISELPDFYFQEDYLIDFKLPFADNYFDHIVAFQVLEHHRKPEIMFKEIFRVIKDGGYVLITCPFMEGIHGEPNDYQRLTKFGLYEKISTFGKIVEIKEQGSIFSIISLFFSECLIRFTGLGRFYYFIGVIIFPFVLLFSYISLVMDKIIISKNIFLNYIVVAKKEIR